MKNRHLKIGLYSTVVSIIVIVIAVIVNMVVAALPTAYTKLDTTGMNLYELTENTEAIVEAVDEDVILYLVARDGYEDTTVLEFLRRYELLNDNITVKVIDPAVNPSLTTTAGSHDLQSMNENSVVAVSNKRDYEVDYYSIYVTDYSDDDYYNYYYYGVTPAGTTTFYGEQSVTGAIDYVTTDVLPTLYTLTGHGETELGSGLSGYLTTDNYATESFTLMTGDGTIPEDASCVLINVPASDISEDELETLKAYVDNGGQLILVTQYNLNGTDFSNLYALAQYYGMNVLEGLVMESASSNYYQYPYYLIPNLSSVSEISSSMSGSYVLMPQAEAFTISDELREGLGVQKILYTTSDAYTCTVVDTTVDDTTKYYEGECIIGAVATYTGEDDVTGRFVWYTSGGVTDDSIDSYISGGNSTLFLNTMSTLCGKSASVSIAGKVMSTESLVVSTAAANLWGTIFMVIIPIAVVIIGFGIWYSRRKK